MELVIIPIVHIWLFIYFYFLFTSTSSFPSFTCVQTNIDVLRAYKKLYAQANDIKWSSWLKILVEAKVPKNLRSKIFESNITHAFF